MNIKSILLVAAVLVLAARSAFAEVPAPIEFSPPVWKYGMIERGEVTRLILTVNNRGEKPLRVTFIPTCTCLTVSPPLRTLAPGASATFDMSFDSKDDEGITQRGFIVKTDLPGAKNLYYLLTGVVRVDRPSAAPAQLPSEWQGAAAANGAANGAAAKAFAPGAVALYYYYTPGCRSCEEYLSVEIPKLEAGYGVAVDLRRRDLLDPAAYEELSAFAASTGAKLEEIPALRLGNTLLQGDAAIRSRLPGLLVARAAAGAAASPSTAAATATASSTSGAAAQPAFTASVSLEAIPVMAAGLIDGINPCAFTTLIFLLASLALAGSGRREVLAIGALFSLGVFLTYFGVGFGLFAALRAASGIALVSLVLRWVLVAVLLVFAFLSVVDYTRIRAGRSSEILLQLPNSLKLRIHASIRARAKTAALASSAFALGVVISIFEFACTGQVYLPTLAYLARSKGRFDALLLLALYNFCFIIPLLVVFGASYLGVSSKRITAIFQKRMAAIKLGLAGIFVVLAVLTLLT